MGNRPPGKKKIANPQGMSGGMAIGQIELCNMLDLVSVNVSCVFIYKDIYMPFFIVE